MAALHSKKEDEYFTMNSDDGKRNLRHHRVTLPVCRHEVTAWSESNASHKGCYLPVSGDLENQAELEEKTRLINQVLELQHTLEGELTLNRWHICVKTMTIFMYISFLGLPHSEKNKPRLKAEKFCEVFLMC